MRRHLAEGDALPLSKERFLKIRDLYWVSAYRTENELARPDSWVFSPTKQPRQMTNRNMYWRHPTYEEAVWRQRRFDEDPDRLLRRIAEIRESKDRKEMRVRTGLDDMEAA